MRQLIAALLVILPTLAAAAPPRNIDARVEAVMKASEVPGAAIAIVENGKVTLGRGYGVRKLGSPAAVDADTLFQIGSTTKAFTTAALADPLIEPAFVTFSLRAECKPERIRMKAASPVADFSFDYHDLEFTPAAIKAAR